MDLFTLIVEDEEKFQDEIFYSLRKINPNLKIRFFSSLAGFSEWVAIFFKEGSGVLETAGFRHKKDTEIESVSSEKMIRMLVVKQELFGNQTISLLEKTIDLILKKKMCTEEDKTSVVITLFNHVEIDRKSFAVPLVNNVIYKPFDRLILEEHLRYASLGHQKPSEANFKSNKLEAKIEMVKDIKAGGFSDIGFLTISDRPVVVGETGKFYSDQFISENVKSVMGRCVKSELVPGTKSDYYCWLEYFGIENNQIKKFRKEIFNSYPNSMMDVQAPKIQKNFVILEKVGESELTSALKRFLPKINTIWYDKWDTFVFDYMPELSGVIADSDLPQPAGFKIILDGTGHYILGSVPESFEGNVFGSLFVDIKKFDFHNLLTPESKKVWLDVFRNQNIEVGKEPLLCFQNVGKKFLVRLDKVTKSLVANKLPSLELQFSELSMNDKINYFKKISPFPGVVDYLIVSSEFLDPIKEKDWFKDASIFLISDKPLSDTEEKEKSKIVKDIFYTPVDRNYLVKKIFLNYFGTDDWRPEYFIQTKNEVQSAQQIQINEISEAGLTFKYHRPLELGSFRRFYLWTPNELELMDYIASCNYFEELKEGLKKSYFHHFAFFGVTDIYLKNIRLWIRENYIQQKSKDG